MLISKINSAQIENGIDKRFSKFTSKTLLKALRKQDICKFCNYESETIYIIEMYDLQTGELTAIVSTGECAFFYIMREKLEYGKFDSVLIDTKEKELLNALKQNNLEEVLLVKNELENVLGGKGYTITTIHGNDIKVIQ